MTIQAALKNPIIRQAMQDILAKRMVGTYASLEQTRIAQHLVARGYKCGWW
jgi:hypothetical protein